MKCIFFIPVWNQIEEFPSLLDEIRKTDLPCDTLLFVNNGSNDGSEALVRNSGHPYIDLPENKGIGYSFMKAVDWALDRKYDVFGVMASNGKMLPSEMHRITEPIYSGKADYVTGSRFLKGGESPNLPVYRLHSINLVNTASRLLTGIPLTDATCGYRAFRLDIIRRARFDWHAPWMNTYGFEYYLYAKVLLDGNIRWTEVPVTMRYPSKGRRHSKINPVTGGFEMLLPWFAARFNRKGFKKSVE